MYSTDIITVVILAKDKAHVLPFYLKCIESQTYPASKINLYIRTNNNNDHTASILKSWVEKVRTRYHEIYLDDSDVPEQVQQFAPHEWNGIRFKVLGKIRQDSIDGLNKKVLIILLQIVIILLFLKPLNDFIPLTFRLLLLY